MVFFSASILFSSDVYVVWCVDVLVMLVDQGSRCRRSESRETLLGFVGCFEACSG